MPEIITPKIQIIYSESDIKELIKADIAARGYSVSDRNINVNISGGYKNCDCDSWGGPRIGECRCSSVPVSFNGYKITCN